MSNFIGFILIIAFVFLFIYGLIITFEWLKFGLQKIRTMLNLKLHVPQQTARNGKETNKND